MWEESEKVGLKLNIQKTEIMASGPITSWEIHGETVETVPDFTFLGSKITVDGDCSHEKKLAPWKKSYDQPREHIKKQRHYFANKCLSSRRRQWHPTPVLLPVKSHEWRSLVGCSPWGRWGSDMTERLHFPFPFSCIGEGNGNPLHCSCLENPMDPRAWQATVHGVAELATIEVT